MDEKIELLARLLAKNSMKHAFGVTGSGSSWHLITELEEKGVKYFPVSHEASAALMAGAVSRATGQVSASISIKGPGLANTLPGIVYNFFEGNPAISISEAYAANVPAFRKHKRLNHRLLLSSILKGIIGLNDLEGELGRLLQIGQQEIPGPVHIELCETNNEQTFELQDMIDNVKMADSFEVSRFFKLLNESKRPVLLLGSLALRRSWIQDLERLRIPVFTTVSAKGAIDESLEISAGVFTGVGRGIAPEANLFDDCDLVVAIGLRNTEVLQAKPFGKPLVILDEINNGVHDGFSPDILLINSKVNFTLEVIKTLENKSWGIDILQASLSQMRRNLLSHDWLPAVCFDVLNHLEYPHALVLDTGLFCTIGEHVWTAGPNNYFMGSSNSRYMGTALPSSIGFAIGRPEACVFCVVGDGGMRMYTSEIKLAVQEKLPVCVLLMKDNRFGSIACAQKPQRMSSRAVNVLQPSWLAAIEAMGCEAHSIDNRRVFIETLKSWDRNGPLFIEADFDQESYSKMTMHLRE